MNRNAEAPTLPGGPAGVHWQPAPSVMHAGALPQPAPLVMPADVHRQPTPPPVLLPAARRSAWAGAERLLAIRLDNLGDVLMTTPALQAIRAVRPAARLDLLAAPAVLAATGRLPAVDRLIPFAAPWMKASATADGADTLSLLARLRAARYDAAIIFTTFSQSPLPAAQLCHLAGIGLRLAHCHENPYQLLSDWLPDNEPGGQVRHEVRRQLDLVGALGWQAPDRRLTLTLGAADLRAARERLAALGIDPAEQFILLHPGASAASRRYPPAHWRAVIAALGSAAAHPLILTGDASERDLVHAIAADLPIRVHCLAGELALGPFAALLKLAAVLVSNNSGPVHLACAVGTPVVDLYALTNPQHTPWGVPNRVLYHPVTCGFCYRSICGSGHHACLREIDPAAVRDAALALMDASRAG